MANPAMKEVRTVPTADVVLPKTRVSSRSHRTWYTRAVAPEKKKRPNSSPRNSI
jgi:hypothetical protein